MENKAFIKDNKIREELSSKGYTVMDLLSGEEVALFLSNWNGMGPDVIQNNYCSILSTDVEFNKKVNALIYSVFNKKLTSLFNEIYPIVGGSVLVKGTQPGAEVLPHMDPTIVDETQYKTFNVWVPMCDVDESNGCLHMFNNYSFASRYFMFRPLNYDAVNPINLMGMDFWSNATPVRMKAGQALIFDHKLPHASRGNYSSENRVAVSMAIVPRAAELFFYYQDPSMFAKNRVEKYWVDYTSYYTKNERGIPQKYKKKDTIRQFPLWFFLKLRYRQWMASRSPINIWANGVRG